MRIGLEILRDQPSKAKNWGRCALLCNQASLTSDFTPTWTVLQQLLGKRLVALFGPQHGLEATVQDNMIETAHSSHSGTGLPVYSLYSETREPTADMLKDVDTILIDIQIVGCRVYTFKYTIAACLRAAKKHGKRVVVLDRPNPLGGVNVEGRVLDLDATSFVGEFAIPMRHGMTPAESARLFNAQIGADLECVALEEWSPDFMWHQTGRDWIITSPNLPTIPSVYVYPGTVMLEGTNISEGRGTGLPFQFVGAPYIKSSQEFSDRVRSLYGPGAEIVLRPTEFQPTSQKWTGQPCRGAQIHVVQPERLRSFDLGLAVVRAAIELGGDEYRWKEPPYEYDLVTLPMKLIIGSQKADQKFLANDFSVRDRFWHEGIAAYINRVEPFLIYPRKMQQQA